MICLFSLRLLCANISLYYRLQLQPVIISLSCVILLIPNSVQSFSSFVFLQMVNYILVLLVTFKGMNQSFTRVWVRELL